MRNDAWVRVMILFCAVAGCLTGFGIDGALKAQRQEKDAKDNTLLREEYDGVFFDEENKPMPTIAQAAEPTVAPTVLLTVTPTIEPTIEPTVAPTAVLTVAPTIEPTVAPTVVPTIAPAIKPTIKPTAVPTMVPTIAPTEAVNTEQETPVLTYPAQIFGQTPVVDRVDEYVTYFEFATDLISAVEGEIQEKKLNEASLISRFMLKALFCGIDIRSLRINDPIPRDQAALAIYLAAELLGKEGTGTTAKSAEKYVTDLDGCSSSERKAIAYLYEQGIETGYSVAGQCFLPSGSLREEDISEWLERVQERWK